jgi:hypothetical protein
MIPRDHFLNKIRALGYKFKDQKKRISLWRKPGTTHPISLPHTVLLEDEYVQSTLRQAGCSKEEIESFLASAKS